MGASSGMGEAVARYLLADGYQVGLCARRLEPLQRLTEAYPQQTFVKQIDVTMPEAVGQLTALIEAMGGIDLYFHASGIGKQNPDLELGIELNTVETNAMGFTRMIDTVFNIMRVRGGGHIAAISSIAGTKGLSRAPSYSATKAYQNTYLQALDQLSQSAHLNICITDIRPGFVDTPLIEGSNFPMLIAVEAAAKQIYEAVKKRKRVAVIDGRYRVLVALWRCIPNWLWRKINLLKA